MALRLTKEEQTLVNKLTSSWIWIEGWIDSSPDVNTAGRLVEFEKHFDLLNVPSTALLHCSADTRYKLLINGRRVAVGPTRGSTTIWHYDSIDIAPFLIAGHNVLKVVVMRYFAASRAAMPFARTAYPGLTVVGDIKNGPDSIDLGSMNPGWTARVNKGISFPTGLIDDVFLHINERGTVSPSEQTSEIVRYNIKTLNGELSPWRLMPRGLPMPEESKATFEKAEVRQSDVPEENWQSFLKGKTIVLPANSTHKVELQATVHSTAFLRWTFRAASSSSIKMKALYSEGYEQEPRAYPFFRTKDDRLDSVNGQLIGPLDEIEVMVSANENTIYEPFWFRTFRIIQLTLQVGQNPVEMLPLDATQGNYPMDVKGFIKNVTDPQCQDIWDVSVRTMRNCMFDAYVDCPFYEQLQYIGDSRTVGLFHYLISGDDLLMRRTISNFAAAVTVDGLPQSRYPSQVPQIIAGFALYWILQVNDHYLYFGDADYAKSFLPRVDGVLTYFDAHLNDQGLVAGLPEDVWQFVDWVTTWGATTTHPDKGVPTSGRSKNQHTYFTLLYAYVLKCAADLVQGLGRSGVAEEYRQRATALSEAAREHCFDGQVFTDSTADIADDSAYSQHCQVFAVLAGACQGLNITTLLENSFANSAHSKCSYMMMFYAFRAFKAAGDDAYNKLWQTAWNPWRNMLTKNLTTWEEDDVRQRSDCHAWGSVPLYEYCTELAGVEPVAAGCKEIMFSPRITLSEAVEAKVMLGRNNSAFVKWSRDSKGVTAVELRLDQPASVTSRLPGEGPKRHGLISTLSLTHTARS
ncbi:alpha-L-rhamnosidase [Elsinoe ampelina]|uniref:Alpha-L-rhamnosidase n=1 Tax=Elsinoe ampelina TaxID=302913 RepID=A0A6A6GKC8_9PEZI|nr:alpha-L-rhamnosidase [Elsinoe ampelina]